MQDPQGKFWDSEFLSSTSPEYTQLGEKLIFVVAGCEKISTNFPILLRPFERYLRGS